MSAAPSRIEASKRIFIQDDTDEYIKEEGGVDGYFKSPPTTIRVAVDPLTQMFPGIENAAESAKRKYPILDRKLTSDEEAAITLYTLEMQPKNLYAVLNKYLRKNNAVDAQPLFLYMKLLMNALGKLPSYQGSVWRGVHGDVAHKYKTGMNIRWWAFNSCTKAASVTQQFINREAKNDKFTIFMIECVSGKDISAFSEFKNEKEILLLPGTRLEVIDPEFDAFGMRLVHLKEIPSKTDDSTYRNNRPTSPAVGLNNGRPGNSISCANCSTRLDTPSSYREGQEISCPKCSRSFVEITCPHCDKRNVWKNADREQGGVTTCWSCKERFQHINCPHCTEPNLWKNADHAAGSKTTCWSCKRQFQYVTCPHCSQTNFWQKADYKQGKKVSCCSCNKRFQHLKCPHCSKANYWKSADYEARDIVKCHSCRRPFQHVICPHCDTEGYFRDADVEMNEDVKCHACSKRF